MAAMGFVRETFVVNVQVSVLFGCSVWKKNGRNKVTLMLINFVEYILKIINVQSNIDVVMDLSFINHLVKSVQMVS